MSRITSTNLNITFFQFLTLAAMLLLPWPVMAIEPATEICQGATEVTINSSFSGYAGLGDAPHVFRLQVPAAGLVSLDIVTAADGPGTAKMGRLDGDCSVGESVPSDSILIEEGIARLLLLSTGPETIVFRVAAQDPRFPLQSYRATIGFVEAEVLQQSADLAGLKDLDNEEREDPGEIEIEPCHIPKPRGEGSSLTDPLPTLWQQLCQGQTADDHGDTLTCATPLPTSPGTLLGEIRNRTRYFSEAGDDSDVFVFRLDESRTVDLTIQSEIATLVRLYDYRGHQLVTSDDDTVVGQARCVKTLAAGVYFVRVDGSGGAEGAYSLRFETLPF